jgi:hypothetical protein
MDERGFSRLASTLLSADRADSTKVNEPHILRCEVETDQTSSPAIVNGL